MSPTRLLTRRACGNSTQVAISTAKTGKTTSKHTQNRCISQTTSLCSSSNSSQPSKTPSFQKVFASPSWSVRALLPTSSPSSSSPTPRDIDATKISPKTLHHLLRLSSLPPPSTPEEESALLDTLHTQLHFVRAIQAVDTTGVAPLTSIRDESSTTARAAAAETFNKVKEALASETVVGFRGRPRRVREENGRARSAEEVMVEDKTRDRRDRGYYVVESGKVKGGE